MQTPISLEAYARLLGGPGADEAEIAALEASVGARLPDDYRHFLTLTRGGYVPSSLDVFKGEDGDLDEYIAEIGGLGGEHDLVKAEAHPRWAACRRA